MQIYTNPEDPVIYNTINDESPNVRKPEIPLMVQKYDIKSKIS